MPPGRCDDEMCAKDKNVSADTCRLWRKVVLENIPVPMPASCKHLEAPSKHSELLADAVLRHFPAATLLERSTGTMQSVTVAENVAGACLDGVGRVGI